MSPAVRLTAILAMLSTALLLGTANPFGSIPDTVELLCKTGKKSVQTDVDGKPGQSFDVRFDCNVNKRWLARCYPPQMPDGVEAMSMFDASIWMIPNDPSLRPGQAYAFTCYSGFPPVFRFVDFALKMCQKDKKQREAEITVIGSEPARKLKVAFDCDGPVISNCYPNGRDKKGFGATETATFKTRRIFGRELIITCNKWAEPDIS